MYTISKEFQFEAAHQLSGLPDDHQCARLHGHSYSVILELESEVLNEVGFVQDYGLLKPFKDLIDQEFDHRFLNQLMLENPTAENMAKMFYNEASLVLVDILTEGVTLVSVTVKETAKTASRYRP